MLPHYLGTLVLYHSDLVGRQDSHSGSIENHTVDQNLFVIMKVLHYESVLLERYCKILSIRDLRTLVVVVVLLFYVTPIVCRGSVLFLGFGTHYFISFLVLQTS